ncbi:SRPBCC family protein [Nitratireductor pacificus]|uniref:Activator of Hsp90 ATPase 1 family protein n=1 Tax=Nitratireductor pacificus pht-3B TaxID=391937 RepID=K2M8S7_9HYPH|nr:SRPBCC domain-containing protein [Nitratireductor pacificus]EKF17415.1 Activator of Hsp90 ATPase 1 family protein [Nitratireductor pacificus pht-3B]
MPDPSAKTLAGAEAPPALSLSRVFDAPRSLVFRLWSSPEHLARWWGPKDFSVPSVTMDFRENGAWRSCIRSPDGDEYWSSGVYREIDAPGRLIFTFRWEEDGALDTLVTVTFEEAREGSATRVTFHQTPFRNVEERDSHADGWGECLMRLEQYLDKQDGRTQ